MKETPREGLSLDAYTSWLTEIEQQPAWRARADRESDYYDGNQLDSDVLQRQRQIGMPPAIEPLIGPTIDAVLGQEAKNRRDWRVTPDGESGGDEVAEALNYKLNQAERQSRADDACSAAYASQIKVGIGWVEVARENDPFKFPYRATAIHRNEIWWDFLAKCPHLSDARYLVRRKWTDRKRAQLLFPEHAELIKYAANGWQAMDPGVLGVDGAASTDLSMAWNQERGWSIEEQEWRDIHHDRVCLFEVWYREWERVLVLKMPDGRVVEYDDDNEMHNTAIALAGIKPVYAVVPRVYLSWWLGPHKLHDGPSPYKHKHFPYVPFWGKREDRTLTPYGLVRGMIYLQDEVNARISKMQWGLAAVRTVRTDGAVLDDDERFRQEVARPDADIVLDPEAMRQGGVFRVERDFQLNQQQYERLVDAREGIKRTGGIYNAFMGQEGQGKSGVAIASLSEQSNQTLADINDNFDYARRVVGEILLSLLIEDMIGKPETVTIPGDGLKDDQAIRLNVPVHDEESGTEYLDNDVERTRLMVAISDVPSTPSFKVQQLAAMSEAFKAAPPEYQRVMMPHLFALMDVPNKQEMIEAIKEAENKPDPDQVMAQAELDLKRMALEQKAPLIEAQVKETIYKAVSKAIEAMFSATQAAGNIAMQPQVAPLADTMLKSGGFVDQNAAPIIPSLPSAIPALPPASQNNTSPNFPDRIQQPDANMMAGIEGGQ